jgi:hypothetical protein
MKEGYIDLVIVGEREKINVIYDDEGLISFH